MSLRGNGTAVGGALLRRVAPAAPRLQKTAVLRTAVLGYPTGYNFGEQMDALDALERLKAEGRPLTDLPGPAYAALAKSNNSFAGPTFSTITALRRAGIPVDPYPIEGISPDTLRRIAADRNVGSVIQVGALPPAQADIIAHSGKHFGRLATDYGSGGYLQPRYHLHGNGSEGSFNGMYIDPTVKYNAVYMPGGKLRRWSGVPSGAPVVPIDRLAISPMFSAASFNQTRGPVANAFMTSGGGSGIGLPFEYKTLGGLGATTDRSLMHPAPNILDHLLAALRAKHGEGKYKLSYLTGLDPAQNNLTMADYEYLMNRSRYIGSTPDLGVGNDLRALRQFLNPASPVYQHVARTPAGRAFLNGLAERYRGLNILGRVALPDMAKLYGNADYIIDLPGSSVGEIAQMGGRKTPGMVHLIPQENAYYPRHFRGNALATNALMQPGAKHNIVSVASPTLKEDIARAINEGGFRDWGRAKPVSTLDALQPLVRDIQNAHRARELKAAPVAFSKADKAIKVLWRLLRRR